jgi:choline dehydrogenase
VFPGKACATDEQLNKYIRDTLHTANALTGSCRMGTGADAVVDPDLKVRGVTGVRVCDSSIFPSIPGGQTGTPTVMVAERAADFIINPEKAPSKMVNEVGGGVEQREVVGV